MAFRVLFKNRPAPSATESVNGVSKAEDPVVIPGESLQLWGGNSLVVYSADNRVNAIFAAGEWSRAIREADAEANG